MRLIKSENTNQSSVRTKQIIIIRLYERKYSKDPSSFIKGKQMIFLILFYDIFCHIDRHQYYHIHNIRYITMKTTVTVVITLLALLLIGLQNFNKPIFATEESSANFSENDKVNLRFIIYKAGSLFNPSRELIASYIKNETQLTFSGFWNVAVFTRQDLNAKFYLTGTYDSTHLNKRYFQILDSEPYGFSVLILETNNTIPNVIVEKKMEISKPKEQLQYSKSKSQYVSSSQEAGIDLAITTAYTWNKNIIDFTKVLQKLVETNLNEHWEVCTNIESINFRFLYTSPYQQWVEYSGYGLSNPHWHVYLYRNYLTG